MLLVALLPLFFFEMVASMTVNAVDGTIVAPMQLYTHNGEDYIGTSTSDCTEADPDGSADDRYIDLTFTAPLAGIYTFSARLFAPHALANSFWLTVSGHDQAEWGVPKFLVTKLGNLDMAECETTYNGDDIMKTHYELSAGNFNVRVKAREPGAGLVTMTLNAAPPIQVTSMSCPNNECNRKGGDVVTVQGNHFYDPSLFDKIVVKDEAGNVLTSTYGSYTSFTFIAPPAVSNKLTQLICIAAPNFDKDIDLTYVPDSKSEPLFGIPIPVVIALGIVLVAGIKLGVF